MPNIRRPTVESPPSTRYSDVGDLYAKIAELRQELAVHVERDDLIQAQLKDNQVEVKAQLLQNARILVAMSLFLAGLVKSDLLISLLTHIGGK